MTAFKKDHLRLSGDGIFYTIQGEGPNAGTPMLFMRLHECNLACEWCDAWYTWKKDTKEYQTEGRDIPIAEVADMLGSAIHKHDCHRLVITGGEPLMQRDQITTLLEMLWWDLTHIEVETNGTIAPMLPDHTVEAVLQYNVSPKTSNSGNTAYKRYKKENLERFRGHNSYFKFVVADMADVAEIKEIVADCQIGPAQVILMPEGTTPAELKKHMQACVQLAMAEGWRVTPRLQIEMFGNRRAT